VEISKDFLIQLVDSITEHIAVINKKGEIVYVNKSWIEYGKNNASKNIDWIGINYLKECDKAAAMGDDFGIKAGKAIRCVVEKKCAKFEMEYPCHSPNEKRWFLMSVASFSIKGEDYFVVSHRDITKRKLAEEEVRKLARIDGLTGVANRRAFDEFINEEWRRCARLRKPISIAIVDLDHFKLLNDCYGHLAGDECLKKIANLLKEFAKRPSDLCARYGGEEFILIWGDTTFEQAKSMAEQILKKIRQLHIINKSSLINEYLTASIGVASMIPDKNSNVDDLIKKADEMLYTAKRTGRNKVVGWYDV